MLPSTPQVTVGPGGRVRFAVFDAADGRRSQTWTVLTDRNDLDAYLLARSMGHVWHMSLHPTGDWHSTFTEYGAAFFLPGGGSRHFDTWRCPAEFAPGSHRSVEVVFPDSSRAPFRPE